jgi:hypothetical protein
MNSKGRKEMNLKITKFTSQKDRLWKEKNESPEKVQVIWQSQKEASMTCSLSC